MILCELQHSECFRAFLKLVPEADNWSETEMSKESANRRHQQLLKMDRNHWVAIAIAAATRAIEREHGKGRNGLGIVDSPDRSRFV